MAAAECADDQDCRDSMKQCFDEVYKELNDELNSIPLHYLERRLEDHFQVVHAIGLITVFDAILTSRQTGLK